ncbi:MAG: hypothetical protein B7X95_01355, partial [Methylophilaceae bacterium 17-44-8]
GAPVLRANNGWNKTLNHGDILIFVVRPEGGGGGSNPLKVVLMIGLSLAAPWAAGALAPTLGLTTELSIGILAGAIGIAGKMVINAMIPDSAAGSRNRAQSTQQASPTYSLSAQGNSARLLEPIPVQYGRHLCYPDYVAEPYTDYQGNEQYLYQLFCIGQGEYDIEAVRIEDTPVTSFAEITYEVVLPGQRVKLFPTNVITATEVAGQEITTTILGPFVANPPSSLANKIAIDVVCSRGLFFANDEGGLNPLSLTFKTEARAINDLGVATGSWFTLGTETISAANSTPIRRSYLYTVTEGRYEVRAVRLDAKNTNSRAGHEVSWAALRTYIPGLEDYGDITLLAMRLRATNNLSSQSSRRVNVICTRKLPIWNGTTWSAPTATNNPAWAMADVLRAHYGGRSSNSRIDLAQLLTLAGTYTSRGDTFNARFDSRTTIFEALMTIGKAVRTKPYPQGAVWHFWRDAPQSLPVAMFNMRNIMRGTVKAQYLTPNDDTADCIDIEFFNDVSWTWDVVRAKLPDATETRPAKMRIFGITNRTQAWREGMYECAANRYRRNLVTLNTEMEGFIPTFGDLVAVQHDRPRWGQAGDVIAYDAGTRKVTTSEPLDFTAGGNHYFRFKNRNGSGTGYYLSTAGTTDYEAILDTALSFTPDVGIARERTTYNFGPADKVDRLCLTRAIRPRSLENVEMSFVIEDPAVHTADTGTAPPASSNWNLPILIMRPVVTGLVVTLGGNASAPLLNVSWVPAPGADYYHVEYSYDGQLTWTRAGEPGINHISFPATRSDVAIRVRGVGRAVGNWAELTATNLFLAPPPNVSSFLISQQSDGTRQFEWALAGAPPPDLLGYRIRYRTGTNVAWDWDDLQPLHEGLLTSSPWETNQLDAGEYTFAIKAVDDSKVESTTALFTIADLGDQRQAGVLLSVLPHTQGWPGTKTDCHIEGTALVANDSTTWTAKTNWSAWTRWNVTPENPIVYEHTVIDLGGALAFTPLVDAIATGTVLAEESHSTDGFTYSSWAAVGTLITARYIKIRATITASGGDIAVLNLVNIKLSAESISEEINDLTTSALAGVYRLGTGDVRLPIAKAYSLISQVQMTLQNVGAGWTWELIDKDTTIGPRVKIYNASNALADASIDAFIRGA